MAESINPKPPFLLMVGQLIGDDGEMIRRGIPLVLPHEDFEMPWYFSGPMNEAESAVRSGRLAEAGAILSRIERSIGVTMDMTIKAARGKTFRNGLALSVAATKEKQSLNKTQRKAIRTRKEADQQRTRDFEAVGMQGDAWRLVTNEGVEIDRESQDNVERARRKDAFDALRSGMEAGAYDAARRLERDVVIRRGEHDAGRPQEKVDGAIISAYGRNDAIIAAAERIEAVMKLIGLRDRWLLLELIAPSVQSLISRTSWRDVVAHVTGEETPHGQCAAVRSATSNLRMAYEQVDRRPRAA